MIVLLDKTDLLPKCKDNENPNIHEDFKTDTLVVYTADLIIYETPSQEFKIIKGRWTSRGKLDSFDLEMSMNNWTYIKKSKRVENVIE